jgi:NAD(P)-dependent dehydrogenase (short-subunit alcohol dehydrogenase family)
MADPVQVQALVAWTEETIGPISVLVNNAGVNIRERSLESLSIENWDYVMQVNAHGAFYVVHAVLPAMRSRRSGLIINISSMAGVRGSSVSGAAYSASKHALNALTQVIAEEEGKHGIRATSICPGAVNTPILDDRPAKVSDEQRTRILQPEDVAAAVMFVVALPDRAHIPELHITPAK